MIGPQSDAPATPDAEGRLRRQGRQLFDRLEAEVASSPLSARAAIAVAAGIGALRRALSGRWPSTGEVSALFGTSGRASRAIARRIAATEARNRLVIARGAGRALAPFAPRVRWRDPEAAADLRPPLVFATAHVGALYLLAAGLDRLPGRRTVLRWSPQHLPSAGERNAATEGGVERRANALREALLELRDGGFAVSTLDGGGVGSIHAEVCGRPLDVGPGAFALGRLSGAPVVAVSALWRGTGVVCEIGPRLDGPEAAARWLDGLLRREPGQITLGLLRWLLLGPPPDRAEEHRLAR